MSRLIEIYDELAKAVGSLRAFDFVAFLTAYCLFRISHNPIDLSMAILVMGLTCLSTLRRNPWFWLSVSAVWLTRMYLQFHHYEDHCFFVAYWCGALGLVQLGQGSEFVMRRSAALLIGTCFGFGFIWKVISPEFYDGSLFHFKLLFDYRFAEMVSQPIGGLSSLANGSNLDAYHAIRNLDPSGNQIAVSIPNRVTLLAHGMTYWTILIEGLLAAAFLFSGPIAKKSRDLLLMFFMLTTYLIVPVMGFASIFTTLGIAQTRSDRIRLGYLITHALVFAWYSMRW